MLAPDGRCKTLDAAAEGYVRAEAVNAMWLRCLKSVAVLTLGPNKPVRPAPTDSSLLAARLSLHFMPVEGPTTSHACSQSPDSALARGVVCNCTCCTRRP